jgi:hypothetical protein
VASGGGDDQAHACGGAYGGYRDDDRLGPGRSLSYYTAIPSVSGRRPAGRIGDSCGAVAGDPRHVGHGSSGHTTERESESDPPAPDTVTPTLTTSAGPQVPTEARSFQDGTGWEYCVQRIWTEPGAWYWTVQVNLRRPFLTQP